MKLALFVSVGVIAILAACGVASATIIADYHDDFVSPTPTAGWSYQWNPSGAIGTASNYVDLVGGSTMYTAAGDWPNFPAPSPAAYLLANSTSVLPGEGTAQLGQGSVDHYAIVAYTIQGNEAGNISITGSSINRQTEDIVSSGTVNLKVYVDDVLINELTGIGHTAQSFNWSLGTISAGHTVYVAVGPAGDQTYDQSNFNFHLDSVPEPCSIILLATGLVGLLAYAWRKRR